MLLASGRGSGAKLIFGLSRSDVARHRLLSEVSKNCVALICPINAAPQIKKGDEIVELSRASVGFWPLISVSELFMAERSGFAQPGEARL